MGGKGLDFTRNELLEGLRDESSTLSPSKTRPGFPGLVLEGERAEAEYLV